MLRWVPFLEVGEADLDLLARSLQAAPAFERPAGDAVVFRLWTGTAHMFRFGNDGVLVAERRQGADGSYRLNLTAFAGRQTVWQMRELAKALRRLAADWQCDTIETLCYDPRLARAIERAGGSVESIAVTLRVES